MVLRKVHVVYILLIMLLVAIFLVSPNQWGFYSSVWKNWICLSGNYGLMQTHEDDEWLLRTVAGIKFFRVDSFEVKDGYIIGKTVDHEFYALKISGDKEPHKFISEDQYKNFLSSIGVKEYDFREPDIVVNKIAKNEAKPWFYKNMRGLFGIKDIDWGFIFAAVSWFVNLYAGYTLINKNELLLLRVLSVFFVFAIFFVLLFGNFDPVGGEFAGLVFCMCIGSFFLRLGVNLRCKKDIGVKSIS